MAMADKLSSGGVNALFQRFFKRDATRQELDYWTNKPESTLTGRLSETAKYELGTPAKNDPWGELFAPVLKKPDEPIPFDIDTARAAAEADIGEWYAKEIAKERGQFGKQTEFSKKDLDTLLSRLAADEVLYRQRHAEREGYMGANFDEKARQLARSYDLAGRNLGQSWEAKGLYGGGQYGVARQDLDTEHQMATSGLGMEREQAFKSSANDLQDYLTSLSRQREGAQTSYERGKYYTDTNLQSRLDQLERQRTLDIDSRLGQEQATYYANPLFR